MPQFLHLSNAKQRRTQLAALLQGLKETMQGYACITPAGSRSSPTAVTTAAVRWVGGRA